MSAQGVVCPVGCLPRGVCLRGVYQGGLHSGGVCIGGVCPGDVCPGDVRLPSLWTEFLTHTCENITFLQLRLRTAIIDDKSQAIGLTIKIQPNPPCYTKQSIYQAASFHHQPVPFSHSTKSTYRPHWDRQIQSRPSQLEN